LIDAEIAVTVVKHRGMKSAFAVPSSIGREIHLLGRHAGSRREKGFMEQRKQFYRFERHCQ
jgi:hypothetical protein